MCVPEINIVLGEAQEGGLCCGQPCLVLFKFGEESH